jgi:hypothetical protein
MKLTLRVEDKTTTATLIDNETTRDLVAMLPLTLTMHDMFGREKFAHLPKAMSEAGERTSHYEIGDVIYWPPGPDMTIFYRRDGRSYKDGMIVIGKIESGVEALNVPGSLEVTLAVSAEDGGHHGDP